MVDAHPCADCGDETWNVRLCRDCDIERLVAMYHCRECGQMILREDMFGARAAQHADGCSLADSADPFPPWDPMINA